MMMSREEDDEIAIENSLLETLQSLDNDSFLGNSLEPPEIRKMDDANAEESTVGARDEKDLEEIKQRTVLEDRELVVVVPGTRSSVLVAYDEEKQNVEKDKAQFRKLSKQCVDSMSKFRSTLALSSKVESNKFELDLEEQELEENEYVRKLLQREKAKLLARQAQPAKSKSTKNYLRNTKASQGWVREDLKAKKVRAAVKNGGIPQEIPETLLRNTFSRQCQIDANKNDGPEKKEVVHDLPENSRLTRPTQLAYHRLKEKKYDLERDQVMAKKRQQIKELNEMERMKLTKETESSKSRQQAVQQALDEKKRKMENHIVSTITEGSEQWGNVWGIRGKNDGTWVGPTFKNGEEEEQELREIARSIAKSEQILRKSERRMPSLQERTRQWAERSNQLRYDELNPPPPPPEDPPPKASSTSQERIEEFRKLLQDEQDEQDSEAASLSSLLHSLPEGFRNRVEHMLETTRPALVASTSSTSSSDDAGFSHNRRSTATSMFSGATQDLVNDQQFFQKMKKPVEKEVYHPTSIDGHVQRLRAHREEQELLRKEDEMRLSTKNWKPERTVPKPFNLSQTNRKQAVTEVQDKDKAKAKNRKKKKVKGGTKVPQSGSTRRHSGAGISRTHGQRHLEIGGIDDYHQHNAASHVHCSQQQPFVYASSPPLRREDLEQYRHHMHDRNNKSMEQERRQQQEEEELKHNDAPSLKEYRARKHEMDNLKLFKSKREIEYYLAHFQNKNYN